MQNVINPRYILVTPEEAIAFVKTQGVVLESGSGPVPNLAETVVGAPIRGSWWGHPKGHEIFLLTLAVRSSKETLVCRLLEGKVTYVHRRIWAAVVRLQASFDKDHLGAIREIHGPTGKHEVEVSPFPDWVPAEVKEEAEQLTDSEAASQLGEWFEGKCAERGDQGAS